MVRPGPASESFASFVDENVAPGLTGPKTDPAAPHNAKIAELEALGRANGDSLIGGGSEPEPILKTPGGFLSARRPDLLFARPDGSIYGVNVGLAGVDGFPVLREAEALHDLRIRANLEMYFVPYGGG